MLPSIKHSKWVGQPNNGSYDTHLHKLPSTPKYVILSTPLSHAMVDVRIGSGLLIQQVDPVSKIEKLSMQSQSIAAEDDR